MIQPEVRGVTFKEVYDFFEFMKNIHDVDTAFAFYAMSGKVLFPSLKNKNLMKISGNRCRYNEKCRPNSLWN